MSPKVKFLNMDVRSPNMASAMAGHEIVVHLASVVLWPAKMPAKVRDDIDFNGTRNVAHAAVKNRVRCFIHASSVAAYDPEVAPGKSNVTEDFPIGKGVSPMYYWNSKAITEKILAEVLGPSGITLTVFRPTYITGSRDRATVRGFRENTVTFPGHDPRVQFVHEADVAAAFAQAMSVEMPGAYNVVPDGFLRLSEVSRAIGVKSTLTVPVWLARLVTYIRWRYFGAPMHPSWVETALIDFTASNAKLRATGWIPHYDSAGAIRMAP